MSKGKDEDNEKIEHGSSPKKPDVAIIVALISLVGVLIGGFFTVVSELIENGYIKPEPSPTFTFTETLPPATLTLSPALTNVPLNPTFTVTLWPTNTSVPIQENTPAPCSWQAYSDGDVETADPLDCIDDVVFGKLGISQAVTEKIDFSVDTRNRGIYGLVKSLGPVQKIEKGFEFTVNIKIKELTASRLIIAFSPNPRPDVQFAYAIVISPDDSRLITKYLFYPANEIPQEIVFRDTPKINTIQGINYVVKFVISYPNLSVDINSGSFKQKACQINFNEGGYIFIGYQRISSSTARTSIDAEVDVP
jgi:hypothetical protein